MRKRAGVNEGPRTNHDPYATADKSMIRTDADYAAFPTAYFALCIAIDASRGRITQVRKYPALSISDGGRIGRIRVILVDYLTFGYLNQVWSNKRSDTK